LPPQPLLLTHTSEPAQQSPVFDVYIHW